MQEDLNKDCQHTEEESMSRILLREPLCCTAQMTTYSLMTDQCVHMDNIDLLLNNHECITKDMD